jgi:hypothetical protein
VGIAGMVVWTLTAGIGIYLLAVGIAAHRAGAAAGPVAAAAQAVPRPAEEADDEAGQATVVGSAALTMVLRGQQTGGERPGGARPAPEGSPLLEFVHPALALIGLTFWICYTMTGYRTFAWIAFGVVVATVAAGLSWEAARRRTARPRAGSAPGGGTGFPPHLVALHGLAAACTFALVVIAAAVVH